MAALDLNTLVIVSAAMLLLIGVVILMYGLGGPIRRAPVAWGLGNAAHAVGMVLSITTEHPLHRLLLIVSNLFIMGALVLIWSGTAHFMGVRRPLWLYLFPMLVTAWTFPIFTYLIPSQPTRMVIASLLSALVCLDSGRMLLTGRHSPTRVLGWVISGVGVLNLFRIGGVGLSLLYPKPFTTLVSIFGPGSLLVFTFWSVGMLVAAAHRWEQDLSRTVDQLRKVALTDQLTQLGNRRYMQQRLEEATAQLGRHSEYFSILFVDADHFKQINDTYGHDCGDSVLRSIAATLRRIVRSEDLLARWGGEEFFVLLPDTDIEGAREVAERLRQSLADRIIWYGSTSFRLTVTIGGATARNGQTLPDLIRRADHALYSGKRKGKNRVEWG